MAQSCPCGYLLLVMYTFLVNSRQHLLAHGMMGGDCCRSDCNEC